MSINNPSYFSQIDSEEKAYWLGFLAADGAISRGRRLEITLSVVDMEHLMKLRDALDSDNKISIITTRIASFGKEYSAARFGISSAQIVQDLARLHVVENKTRILRPPAIPDDLEKHFWRGMIDGDGCITFSVDKRWLGAQRAYAPSLVGTQLVMSRFAGFCEKLGSPVKPKTHHRSEGLWVVRLHRDKGLNIATHLYDGAVVYLDRKMARVREWQAYAASHVPGRKNYVHSPETRQKISQGLKGKPNGRTGKPSPLKGAKYIKIINAATGEIEKKYIPAPKTRDGA
jgi:NUMOD3 motif